MNTANAFEAVVNQHGREFYLKNGNYEKKRKGIFSPYFYSNKSYKPLTPYEKQFLRLQVLPNVPIYTTSRVTLDGKEYEVKSVRDFEKERKVLYKTAVLRLLRE